MTDDDISFKDLQTTVRTLRRAAQGRMRDDRSRLWPHVSDHDFNAVLDALGEISILEARIALARLEVDVLRELLK